jgi:flagellar hook assembly protein FlgD
VKGPLGVDTPTPVLSFSVFPNPARRANVNFTLPHAADVQLGVYDVAGRRVALLASGNLPAGSYQRAWDGRDESGTRMHSGVYFYRLRAGNEVRRATAVLLSD